MENVKFFKLFKTSISPTRNNPDDAGIDLYAIETTFIQTGKSAVIRTGIALNIPKGYVGKIEDRSSLAAKGLRTGAGVVDSGYSGEVGVVMHNLNNSEASNHHGRGYLIERGQKIAQVLIHKVETPTVEETDVLWSSDRGSKGFGSSGA